jgi:hypothetical protein
MIAEEAVELATGDGVRLEARQSRPADAAGGVVVLHPHPLYGGDMDNPVVMRAVEVCAEAGLATLRFNFRGVGGSTGAHGGGQAEEADCEAALDVLAGVLPLSGPLAVAGYSFGAWVGGAVAARRGGLAGLALIAPPLALRGDGWLTPLTRFGGRLLVVGGTADEFCPRTALEGLATRLPSASVTVVEGANHFFLGKLFPLGEALGRWARSLGP